MKIYISPLATLLIAASITSATATADETPPAESKFAAALGTIEKSVQNPESLSDNEWASQLSCTADLTSQQPSLVDENTCATSKDESGQGCIWCDASASLGSGLCVSPDQKTMLAQYWDQVCAASSTTPDVAPTPVVPVPVVPVISPPTLNPTPLPTNPVPAPDNNNILDCAMDAANVPVTDEATCVAQGAAGSSCAWCNFPLIGGGSCMTSEAKSQLSILCSSEETNKKEGKSSLRGDDNKGVIKKLDVACITIDKDSCASKTDSSGSACTWCELNNFGVCSSSSQKDDFSKVMTCADPAVAVYNPVAVE